MEEKMDVVEWSDWKHEMFFTFWKLLFVSCLVLFRLVTTRSRTSPLILYFSVFLTVKVLPSRDQSNSPAKTLQFSILRDKDGLEKRN